MALPGMARNKFQAERAIQVRREAEFARHESTARDAAYFQRQAVVTQKSAQWGSLRSFETSMDKWQQIGAAEERAQRLAVRRRRLQTLLEGERADCLAELQGRVPSPTTQRARLVARANEIETARAAADREIATARTLALRFASNADVQDASRQATARHLEDERRQQLHEKAELSKRADELAQADALAALEAFEQSRQQDREQKKRLEQDKLSYRHDLLQQIELLRVREEEAEKLRQEAHDLKLEQTKLAEERERRERSEAAVQQQRYGRQLQRQHKARLLQRSRELQADIAQDLAFIDAMAAAGAADKAAMTERRRQAQQDIAWMRDQVQLQLAREHQRERELDSYHQEEAQRMFTKREAEWDRENRAREKLMAEVFAERDQQIVDRMQRVREAQAASLREREELLRDIDAAQAATAREAQTRRDNVQSRRDELGQAVAAKDAARELEMQQAARAAAAQRAQEEEFQKLVELEVQRRLAAARPPTNHGRRRPAWD